MSTSPHTATCTRCSVPLQPWANACANCGYAPRASAAPAPPAGPGSLAPAPPSRAGHPQAPLHVVPAKSPGIAVLLCLLWLGPGALYVGNIGLGVGLLVFSAFLALLSLVPFAMFLTVPVWWIAFALVAVHVSNEAKAFNRRNGIVVH